MKLKRNYLFGTTVLAGILAVSAPAWAQAQQTAAEAADATQVDEIVVTGSRIRRDPGQSAEQVARQAAGFVVQWCDLKSTSR